MGPVSHASPAPFPWILPEGSRIVALVGERSAAERNATVVDAIATSIARRRGQTLVVNSDPGPSPLDELAGAFETADAGGMAEFLGGRAGLARVAVQRADCPYIYLPAGQVPEGVAGILESAAFERFVSRVKECDGTLFLVLSERGRPAPGLLRLLDGYIVLGTAPVEGYSGLECYGQVPLQSAAEPETKPPMDTAESPPQPESGPEPPVPPPPRSVAGEPRGRRPRARRLVTALFLITALALGGWWAYGNGWLDGTISRFGGMIAARQNDPSTPAASATPEEPEGESLPADGADAAPDPPEVPPPPPRMPVPDEAAVAAAFEAAPERPYSVLVASFRDAADAAERLAEIRALRADVLSFISPTTIREVPYHRILAGAAADESEASALMNELVAAGAAEEASAWLVRPVRLAYDLGAFADRQQADARIDELASAGIPVYSLEAAIDGILVFRVYGGAYESVGAATPMGERLETMGESAALVVRRGDAPASIP